MSGRTTSTGVSCHSASRPVTSGKSAWFTDSRKAVLYEVPLNLKPYRTLQLTGDLVGAQPALAAERGLG